MKNDTKKNLKNRETNEKKIKRKIFIPKIPDPIQVILYGKGEKPPITIKIIPISINLMLNVFNLKIKVGQYSDKVGEIIFHKKYPKK